MTPWLKSFGMWVAYNGLVAYAVFVGLAEGNDGWGRVLILITVLALALALTSTTDKVVAARRAALKEKPFAVPIMVDFLADLAIAAGMAYHNYPWMACAFAFHAVVLMGVRGRIEEAVT